MAIKIKNSTIIDDSRNLVDVGISTITSLNIGSNEVISSSRQLKNIASLDAVTTATIESAIANAPNTFTDLNVSGISTLNIVTANSLSVVGVITASGFNGGPLSGSSGSFTQVNVSGIGTIETLDTTNGTIDYLGSTNINASGIVTAGTFSGNLRNTLTLNTSGTGLSGSTTFNNSGVSTFTVTSNATSANTANTIVARNNSGGFVAGIVTATFVGNLTGNLNSSGINTATTLSGTTLTYTNGSVTNISGTNLNYTGISTISNVRSTTINNTGVGTITTLSGTLLSYTNASVGLGTITTLDFGTNAEHTSNSTVVATTSPTTIDSFAVATFRSARVQVQITQSTNYQTSDVLVIHDGSTASVVEYGSIATNDYLGTFSATVSGGNCLLQINMGSATSATVKVLSQRITV
jgi:hypothetical protein